jgi:hypothetical protein
MRSMPTSVGGPTGQGWIHAAVLRFVVLCTERFTIVNIKTQFGELILGLNMVHMQILCGMAHHTPMSITLFN